MGLCTFSEKCSAPFSFDRCYSWTDSKLETVFSFNSQTCWKTKEKACLTFHWSQWFLSLFALQITSSPLWQERKSLCLSLCCLPPSVGSSMSPELSPLRKGMLLPSAVPTHWLPSSPYTDRLAIRKKTYSLFFRIWFSCGVPLIWFTLFLSRRYLDI